MHRALLLAASTTLAAALPIQRADAQLATYTFTWTGTGTLGTAPVSGLLLTLQASGDLSGLTAPGVDPAFMAALPSTLTVAGLGTFAVSDPIYVFTNDDIGFGMAGFGVISDYLQVRSAALDDYDLRSSIGPVAVAGTCVTPFPCIGGNATVGQTLATSGGTLALSSVSTASFTATVSAVPEPATIALVGGGLLVLGATARRRGRR